MNRYLKALAGLAMAAALAACGGGGGSPGSTPGNPGQNPGEPADPVAATMIYTLSKQSIDNSGGDTAVLTVTALDENNNPVEGVPVTVSVDTGVYTPGGTATGANGQVTGTISIGANKANREITATIRMSGVATSTAVVAVTGSAIALTPVPATPEPGDSVRVDIKVTDANGAGVSNVDVVLSGTLGLSRTVRTDLSGNASATLAAAPATAGTYTVEASALGVESVRSVQVIAAGGGGIPVVTDTISSASLAIVPTTIEPNTAGSTTNRAALRAKFLNDSNQAVQNVRVKFVIDPPGLGSGEAISNTGIVYSDVGGEAIADYIPGTRSSPTDGVVIRACYGTTDASVATCSSASANSVTATLTVAGQPISITLGDNNLLERGNSGLTYIKKFDVAVADAAGNPVSGATVSASVDITHYGKGPFVAVASTPQGTGTYQVTGDNPPNINTAGLNDLDTVPSAGTGRIWCPNEDLNRNGSLDRTPVNEDVNGNGKLEPRKADVILSFLDANVTGTDGRMAIQVEYPQNVATWLAYTVRVTTNAAGSEGTDAKSYITTYIEGDQNNGSFLTPPYGTRNCRSAN